MPVFQTEVNALPTCIDENLKRSWKNKKSENVERFIFVRRDGQAALITVWWARTRNSFVQERADSSKQTCLTRYDNLVWVYGYNGIPSNEKSDKLSSQLEPSTNAWDLCRPFPGILDNVSHSIGFKSKLANGQESENTESTNWHPDWHQIKCEKF